MGKHRSQLETERHFVNLTSYIPSYVAFTSFLPAFCPCCYLFTYFFIFIPSLLFISIAATVSVNNVAKIQLLPHNALKHSVD